MDGETPPVETYDELDSTNAEARRRAEAGEGGPVWITAKRQTAGRGRRGREWSTQEGNLAATLLMTTDRPPAEAAQVSFIAALAVSDVARSFLGPSKVRLKWPNDLMIDGRKAAGILIESGTRADGRLWLAVGIGLNLAHFPEDVNPPATSIAEHMGGMTLEPADVLLVLASAVETWRETWATEGFPAIAEAWTERALGLGQACTARLPDQTIQGVAEGLDPDGALRLRLDDGQIRRITAGDVFFGEG